MIIAAPLEKGQSDSLTSRPALSDASWSAGVGLGAQEIASSLRRDRNVAGLYQCGSGISKTRLLFVSTTTARFSFGSMATEDC